MSAATAPAAPAAGLRSAPARARARRRPLVSAALVESVLIFGVLTAAYIVLGDRVVAHQHVVVGDGLSRLAHGFFVWYNDPAKLAAIGFGWPPLQTLFYLPFGAVKSLSTSLVALAAYSAVFAALTVVVINRAFAFLGMPAALRYPLLLAFAVNPMFAWYGANGMSESLSLFLLAAAFYFFVRWHLTTSHHLLILVGVTLALGFLSRYELGAWIALLTLAIGVLLVRRRRSGAEVEGTMLAFLAPVVYGLAIWCFFCWLIIGDPLHWLKENFSANLSTTSEGTARVADQAGTHAITVANVSRDLLDLNVGLFLPVLIVVPLLFVGALAQRDFGALTLALAGALNAVMTAAFIFQAHDEFLLQLRYNIRAMPIVMIGIGYLFWMARSRWLKGAVWIVCLASVAAAVPLAWHIMGSWPHRYYEGSFVAALKTGKDQEGTSTRGGYFKQYGIGIAPERRMAAKVNALAPGRARVLTDDRWTFAVPLVGGNPQDYLDRIDFGDAKWLRVRDHPFGSVDYMLVSKSPIDLIRGRYTGIFKGGYPFLTRVYDAGPYALFRVVRPEPAAPGAGK